MLALHTSLLLPDFPLVTGETSRLSSLFHMTTCAATKQTRVTHSPKKKQQETPVVGDMWRVCATVGESKTQTQTCEWRICHHHDSEEGNAYVAVVFFFFVTLTFVHLTELER